MASGLLSMLVVALGMSTPEAGLPETQPAPHTGVSAPAAAQPEKATALNGSQYAVIPQVYDGTGGSLSYLRLFNGGSAPTSFNITVVNAGNGLTLGAASIQVPANASPQYPVTAAGGANSIFSQAGVGASGGSYALYIQNLSATAGYEHVTFNGVTSLFENNSVCATPINQQMISSSKQVLTNVHTTALASGNYPSNIGIHNYSTSQITVALAAYDAATGNSVGQVSQTISANATLVLAESQIENLTGFRPTSTQPHINIVVTNAAGGAVPITMTQTIRNAVLGGDINMAEACAANAVTPTVITNTPSVPTAYCGSIHFINYPYSLVAFGFTASVAPTGVIRGTLLGAYNGSTAGAGFSGTLSGTNFSIVETDPTETISGTIQNGVMDGTLRNTIYGNATVTGSTAACY